VITNRFCACSNSKLSLSTNKSDQSTSRDSSDANSSKRFGSNTSSHNKASYPIGHISNSAVSSPTTATGSSAFALGNGAFASFGASATKTPKTPGTAFDFSKVGSDRKEAQTPDRDPERDSSKKLASRKQQSGVQTPVQESAPNKDFLQPWPLRNSWIIHYRPPTNKNSDYEKSMKPMCKIATAQDFWKVYVHLKHPSALPAVSDYHFFKEGIRPVWEDEENKRGGKWIMRLKKGIADRYWEDLLLALIGDQFAEAGEEVCGAVVSVRSGEDVFSIWTKNDGGRNVKIRETLKRVLDLPADTVLQWKSHDDSITQRHAVDQARQEKNQGSRRNTMAAQKQDRPEEESKA
jgi:translation initiation factor 4E